MGWGVLPAKVRLLPLRDSEEVVLERGADRGEFPDSHSRLYEEFRGNQPEITALLVARGLVDPQ